MYCFGYKSKNHLFKLHKDLQLVLGEAIHYVDFSIIESDRDKDTQNRYFNEKKSKLKWPNSKHNLKLGQVKSDAADILPYPSGWPNKDMKKWAQFAYVIGVIRGIAEQMYKEKKISTRLRFGFDFNKDGRLFNDRFIDAPHVERGA